MTYNIHGGRGTDGRIDLDRIAAVISGFRPDIVALQEVDVHRTRSGVVDQPAQLASQLGLAFRFGATIASGTEQYGNATLTRLPILDTYQFCLPWTGSDRFSEPRCALVTRLDCNGLQVDVINTHLSVRQDERGIQIAELIRTLASDAIADAETMILAGDFNCAPWSGAFRMLRHGMQRAASPRSWPSTFPVMPLDHILFRGPLRVVQSGVFRTLGVRQASDHLPVVAELERVGEERAA